MTGLLVTCCLVLGLAVPVVYSAAAQDPETGGLLEKRIHPPSLEKREEQRNKRTCLLWEEEEPATWTEGYLSLETELLKLRPRSTYVRWGRKQCGDKSELVYSGVAGGSHYSHPGAAANALCLTKDPQFGHDTKPTYYAVLYGAEYQHVANQHDQDVPCAVCRVRKPTTIMVPGTRTCPSGWTAQYSGHLMAGHHTHAGATEFLCMDGEPEGLPSGHANHDGHLFYYTKAQCGSLPCPPYVQDGIVTCVVCSR